MLKSSECESNVGPRQLGDVPNAAWVWMRWDFSQFLRYAACGALALGAHTLVFAVLSQWINPAVDIALGDSIRAFRATVNNCAGFLIGNWVAYASNVRWVFVRGRFSPIKEFLFFTSVSGLSVCIGLLLVPFLIGAYGLQTWTVQGLFVLVSVSINFACRKYYIFQRR